MKLRNQLKDLNIQLQRTIDKASNLQASNLRKAQHNQLNAVSPGRGGPRAMIDRRGDPSYQAKLKQHGLATINKQNE